jgi:hypothetical protein
MSTSTTGAYPTEEVSFEFGKYVLETLGKGGKTKEGWDRVRNVKA